MHMILYGSGLLTAVAVLPAVYLMVQIYKADRLEKEPVPFLLRLLLLGIISTFLAVVTESVGSVLLELFFDAQSLLYRFLMYFIVVGLSEEGFKYLLLRRTTWNSPYFNCQFDGVVYAVFVSLGFALWENIRYVMSYGLLTAIVRAVTAVPGHASFGVFMGAFYGMAKRWEAEGFADRSRKCRRLALVVPTFLHGVYDFIATDDSLGLSLIFFVFIAVLFLFTSRLVRRQAKEDRFIDSRFPYFW